MWLGKYEVTLTVESQEIYYDGLGVKLRRGNRPNLLDIGIFSKDGKNDKGMEKKVPLHLEKQWIEPDESTIALTIESEEPPVKAGIDPYKK